MKLDFSAPLLDIEGNPVELEVGKPSTVATACINALLGNYMDEQGLSGEEKTKRYVLARIVAQRNDPVLLADEIETIKVLVAKMYSPVICGQVWLMLDGVDRQHA